MQRVESETLSGPGCGGRELETGATRRPAPRTVLPAACSANVRTFSAVPSCDKFAQGIPLRDRGSDDLATVRPAYAAHRLASHHRRSRTRSRDHRFSRSVRISRFAPARVISRTPATSRRAIMRKPSCLISCSQPGPEGGALAGDGKQGSIMPSLGRVRSRNDMPT